MSSYRSYAPWKSSLPTSYKSGSTSAYSSRDDISSRYGSMASPSTYRPSFSGGTYRIKRDPVPPTSTVTPYVSRYASANTAKDSTKSNDSSTSKTGAASKYGSGSTSSTTKDISQIKRYTTTNSNLPKYSHSREPSPAALERTNRIKSRETSPLARTLRGKSRDPSPAIDAKCKLGYGANNSYRMSSTPRTTSTGYSSRYGSTATASRSSSSNMLDKSISYLSVSDFRARSISRAREISSRKSNEKELEDTTATKSNTIEIKETEQVEKATEESDSESSGEESFISVSVVTRATSPTLPGTTTVQRTRRMDIAKTIEKTINRSTRKKKMLEKEIQSDRMDDPTRYSRFGLSSRVSSYSPHSEGRYTSSNSLRYSASPLSTTSKSTSHNSELKKEETPKRSPSTETTKMTKSKLSPPKAVRINSRQSSVENLAATNANKSLPPTAPKADSPTKTAASATIATVKWPNKDFRKSALNVGPTDRPRKSRTPSTGTESDGTTPLRQRQERSPSACSEGSNASAGSNKKNTETKIRQRCHPKTSTTLGRQNSGTSLKSNAHKSCHPAASALMSSSTSTCSSSGTESANENNKSNKPKKTITKKKPANTLNTEVIPTNEPKRTSPQTEHAGIVDAISIKSAASDKNSRDLQPPAVYANELRTNYAENNTQIPVNKNTATDQTDRADSSQLKMSSKSSHGPLANPQKKATCRLQKLSSVSNFFVARQNDTNSEPIFFESSESSTELDTNLIGGNSLTKEFETNTSPAKIAIEKTFATTTNTAPVTEYTTHLSATPTKDFCAHLESSIERSDSNPPCAATSLTKSTRSSSSSKSKTKSKSKSSSPSTTSDQTASSTNLPTTDLQTETPITYTSTSTEQEEPSWWQDTSRQIDTSSALDFNPKEDMRYRLRHIDSGEVGWWLHNDEDDTLADDDIKTLNQEDEDASEAIGRAQSLPITQSCGDSVSRDDNINGANNTKNSWWVSENNDDNDNNNDNDHNAVADVETQKLESEQDKIDSECEEWNASQKREQCRDQTEDNHWWNESKEETNAPNSEFHYTNFSAKQNGSIQLKICRVESGERPWWLAEDNQATVEATIKVPSKERGKTTNANSQQLERSPSSSNNLTGETHWWMSGPTKKLFNVKRVDSGEKAWWQQEDERESTKSKSSPVQQQVVQTTKLRRSDSGEQAWWLQDNDTQNSPTHKNSPNASYVITPLNNGEDERNEDQSEDEDEHEENGDIEVQQIVNYNNNNNSSANHLFGTYSNSNSNSHLNDSLNYEYVERPPPLGHRASPDGLEDPMRQRKSPFDNIPMTKVHPHQTHLDHRQYQQQHHQQSDLARSEDSHNKQSREKLFISRHKNIDELLGGSCRPLSPLFFEGNSFPVAAAGRNLFLEEITPDQVRIHDSTAQMPVIQRMERDEWDYNTTVGSAARSATAFEPRMTYTNKPKMPKDNNKRDRSQRQKSAYKANAFQCRLCHRYHALRFCPKFLSLNTEERMRAVLLHKHCSNCLAHKHSEGSCMSKLGCHYCKGDHHTLLHMHERLRRHQSNGHLEQSDSSSKSIVRHNKRTTIQPLSPTRPKQLSYSSIRAHHVVTLLPTAVFKLDVQGKTHHVRSILDQCTVVSQISDKIVKKFHLETTVLGGDTICNVSIQSRADPTLKIDVTLKVVSAIALHTPCKTLNNSIKEKFKNLILADPQFYKSGEISVILGADVYPKVIKPGMIILDAVFPVAQNTIFGWILSGSVQI